jgi:YaiO family outer membrane protein
MATVLVPATAVAQSSPAPQPLRWSLQVGGEYSAVTQGTFETVWSSEIVTVAFLDEAAGGWHASVERQARGDASDMVVSTGGYRRLGDWTIGGNVSASPDASFWYRRAVDGELSRRIVGTVVASAAYRFMDFPAATIHQLQPAVTWYNPHGDLQARLYVTYNATQQRTSYALLVRTITRLNGRATFVGAVAAGDRIFDVASLAYGPAQSWTARGGLRVDLSRRNQIEFGGGYASERPAFSQRTIALSYRRAF